MMRKGKDMARHFARVLWLAILLVTYGWSSRVQAQLYAREAPPGSTFIRVFNATTSGGVPVRIADKSQTPLLPYTAGGYIFLPPGSYPIKVGSQTQTFKFEGDHYYTISASNTGRTLFDLHGELTKLKSMISLYNVMPETTLGLKTADGATPVFESVAPNTTTQRPINPLKLSLAVFSGDKKISDVPPVTLERGKSFSLFVGGTEAVPILVWNND
jgi:alginate O-acetyltransferase complex protein AlgF